MNCWDVLEINAADDRKIIKRAYAKKLKLIDVVEDPADFQQLRDAYEMALSSIEEGGSRFDEARSNANEEDIVSVAAVDVLPVGKGVEKSDEKSVDIEPVSEEEVYHPHDVAESVMEALVELSEDVANRNDIGRWRGIFENDQLLDIEVIGILRYWVFEFISERLGASNWGEEHSQKTIDSTVVRYLNQVFNWSEEQIALSHYFSADQLNAVMFEIEGSSSLLKVRGTTTGKHKLSTWMMLAGWMVALACLTQFFGSIAK